MDRLYVVIEIACSQLERKKCIIPAFLYDFFSITCVSFSLGKYATGFLVACMSANVCECVYVMLSLSMPLANPTYIIKCIKAILHVYA